ncbi:hypothetical protein L3X07_07325 [Levilactobacillus brevis]|nr:hypothetical protein [Levilactobacillus brevis]
MATWLRGGGQHAKTLGVASRRYFDRSGIRGITAQATDTAVTTTLPPSMAITGIFNTTSSIANVTNTATLVANNHGLQITEGNNHAGSAWATNNYKVDLSKDATFSLWLYLGKGVRGVPDRE